MVSKFLTLNVNGRRNLSLYIMNISTSGSIGMCSKELLLKEDQEIKREGERETFSCQDNFLAPTFPAFIYYF